MPALRESDRVDRDGQHLREVDAVVEGELIREKLLLGIFRGESGELGVTPFAEHARALRDQIGRPYRF